MSSVVSETAGAKIAEVTEGSNPREAMLRNAANEIVFAVVGHAGSGTSTVAKALHQVLSVPALGYDVDILSARDVISGWATSRRLEVPNAGTAKLQGVELLQDRGDDMRKQTGDFTSVARALIAKVRTTRAKKNWN